MKVKSFAVPAIEAIMSVAMLASHAFIEKKWDFGKHSKFINLICTGALSKDEMSFRRKIAAVLCAIGVATDLVSAIVYSVHNRKTDEYFDEICTHTVDESNAPDFVKEAYKAS